MVAELVAVATGFVLALAVWCCAGPRRTPGEPRQPRQDRLRRNAAEDVELLERWVRIVYGARRPQRARRIFHNTGEFLKAAKARGREGWRRA